MLATTHLSVGAAAGLWSARMAGALTAHKPPHIQMAVQAGAAFIAGTLSHFALDAIPHNDGIYETVLSRILIPELVIIFSIILGLVFYMQLDSMTVFAGMAGAAWPDVFSMLGLTIPLHDYFHTLYKPELAESLVFQLAIAFIALMFLF